MFTAHPSPDYVLDAVRAGAAGYLLKTATGGQISDAVRRVLRNEFPVDQELTAHLIQRLAREVAPRETSAEPATKRRTESTEVLTTRETEVLRLLAAGRTNRRIAQEMHLSLSTVKRHIERIIAKLGVSDRTQAAVRAAELGLLDPLPGRGAPAPPRRREWAT